MLCDKAYQLQGCISHNKTYKIGSAWLFGGNVLEYFVLNNSLMSAQDRITSSHYALLFRDIHLLQG